MTLSREPLSFIPIGREGDCVQHAELFRKAGDVGEDEQVQAARDICTTCPYADACRMYALQHREAWGIWGGTTAAQRDELHKMTAAQGKSELTAGA